MAMLWAQKILKANTIEEAKDLYRKVPRLLKEQARTILIDSGFPQIVE